MFRRLENLMKYGTLVLVFVVATLTLGGCAAGGRMVSSVGDGLSDYGEKHDNSLIKSGGSIYQNIGAAIQGIGAKKDGDAEDGKK